MRCALCHLVDLVTLDSCFSACTLTRFTADGALNFHFISVTNPIDSDTVIE
jgi:hypothetical protein